jgi:hypothetical protein
MPLTRVEDGECYGGRSGWVIGEKVCSAQSTTSASGMVLQRKRLSQREMREANVITCLCRIQRRIG